MMSIWHLAEITIREGQRRNIVRLALIMGILFLVIYGVGMHYIFLQFEESDFMSPREMEMPANILTLMGLYVSNFLLVIMGVLVSVATISSEIDTHVIDTIITKPIRRWEIVTGKWLGFIIMITAYTGLLAGGVLLISYFRTGLSRFYEPA